MGYELLLIDQKGTTIQAFIPAYRLGDYEEKLKAGEVYKFNSFLVINNKKAGEVYNIGSFLVIINKTSYKFSSHRFLIQFIPETTMVQADHDDYTIEGQNFGIRSNAEFNESVDKNEDLYGNNSFIMSRVQSKEDIEKSMFRRWMERNEESEEAHQITYSEFLKKITWNNDRSLWSKVESFEEIQSAGDTKYDDYKSVSYDRGLLDSD
ncbi:unnamed protein product [Microthlaspi erraticum]|uniref:Uncharacterized protein n=1 Tax=Microthlaspi erraticum TaxID=1685480 RepID=A0A6D2JAL7_9BRAS|nr:unnamed protein product [Microthlaspi erraticum]